MTAALANTLEPGQEAIFGVCGVAGSRLVDLAGRLGIKAHVVEGGWGQAVPNQKLRKALEQHPSAAAVCLVHGETSTGVLQPLEGLSEAVHDAGALLLVDAVTTLGGVVFEADRWGVDVAWSVSGRCLSCPSGMALFCLSQAAQERVGLREAPLGDLSLDLLSWQRYWAGQKDEPVPTPPINLLYALREGLQLLQEQGLEGNIGRHRLNHEALRAGLEALGLIYTTPRSLPMVNVVAVPEGIEDAEFRRRLLGQFGLQIAGGVGAMAGAVWRLGLMGYGCDRRKVTLALGALESMLPRGAGQLMPGAALEAAKAVYEGSNEA
jgi:alanine-glyoxylate transaminase/serine-glyoxylate transaminase/serine-pyruvate transaminase